MDIEQELERTFKVPTALLSFLAIITGILVLFFPYILNILIAFFLVVWGLIKAVELGKPHQETKASETPKVLTPESQTSLGLVEEESPSPDPSNQGQAEPSNSAEVRERPARRRKKVTG
jgi:Protein of unknown function (DUF3096)